MNENELNNFLLKGRLAAEVYYRQKDNQIGDAILQITSKVALVHLPPSFKVWCRCGKQLRLGREIEFYKNVGSCYDCDEGHMEAVAQRLSDFAEMGFEDFNYE